jgi:hypothetical protein
LTAGRSATSEFLFEIGEIYDESIRSFARELVGRTAQRREYVIAQLKSYFHRATSCEVNIIPSILPVHDSEVYTRREKFVPQAI